MGSLGLKDMPLSKLDEESLGLYDYAQSLSDFILQCESPLTIALQGDWGSGKTSLMNLIRMMIEDNRKVRKTIWFNTWQYSQFDMSNDLTISLISHFVDEIASEAERNGIKQKLFSFAGKFAKAITIGGAATIGQEKAAKEFLRQFDEGKSADLLDPARKIRELKNDLEELVRKNLQQSDERIVVFIDDLDRLLPEKAVELLEVFKLFLDIPGCVYVLACDYQVVTQGLKRKFGLGAEELKGRSFFDKIIQLPFSMPIGQYDASKYISGLLTRIGVEHEETDVVAYADMVNYSFGFNPRSLKRVFNSLLLLNLVADRKGLFNLRGDAATKAEKQRIMFGVLCLQTAYEPVYRYLQRNLGSISPEFLEALKDETKLGDEKLSEVRREIHDPDGTMFRRLAQFMDVFFQGIQLKSDADGGTLSAKELETLKQVISFSSLTSTDASAAHPVIDYEERYRNRDVARRTIVRLNNKYSQDLKLFGKEFLLYQARQDEGSCQ